jgi:hypothetical protein
VGRLVEGDAAVVALGEDPVEDDDVEVEVCVEGRPEAVQEGDGAELGIARCRRAGAAERGADGAEQDAEHVAGQARIAGQEGADSLRQGQDPLADGEWRQDVIGQVGGHFHHAAGVAGGADAAALAGAGRGGAGGCGKGPRGVAQPVRVGTGVGMPPTVRRKAGRRNGAVGQRGGLGRCRKSPVVNGILYPVSRHGSQEVCPWNGPKFVSITREGDFDGRERERERLRERLREQREPLPGTSLPSLIALMGMTYEDWDQWTRGSAIRRAGYAGLRRSVAVALGNWGAEEAVPVLCAALGDEEALVRGHAAWALGRVGSGPGSPVERSVAIAETLSAALAAEAHGEVRDELALALRSLG